MKSLLLLVLLLICSTINQSPVEETIAYSQSTISGVPGNEGGGPSPNAVPTTYFIYVVVKKGTKVSLTGVCVQGKSYDGTLKRVQTPVKIENDANVPTGGKDILVKKTPDDVYQVELRQAKICDCKDYGKNKLAQRDGVVVRLKSDESSWYGCIEKITPLRPAYAM